MLPYLWLAAVTTSNLSSAASSAANRCPVSANSARTSSRSRVRSSSAWIASMLTPLALSSFQQPMELFIHRFLDAPPNDEAG